MICQVLDVTYLSSDLKRDKMAGWQVKLSSHNWSSWLVSQVELVTASGSCHLRKNLPASSGKPFLRIASASEKVLARCCGWFSACSGLSKISVFGWTRCEIWPWQNPSRTSFSRYKKSRSDTGSTQIMGINKERQSERFSRQRRRASQWSCWLWVIHVFLESKICLPDEIWNFNLDCTKILSFRIVVQNLKCVKFRIQMTTNINVPLKFWPFNLGYESSIHTQHQHIDLFRIEERIPLVTHVIDLRKNSLTKTFGTQSPYLTPRRGGHERKPPIRPFVRT